MSSMQGKLALVTGGTRGIGLGIARALLDHGSSVLVSGMSRRSVDSALPALKDVYGHRVTATVCDVRNYDQVRSMFVEAERSLGGVDILVNNAGIGLFAAVEKMPVADWQTTIDTNLSGVFYCCREAIPLMKKRGGGYIINIGSLAGKNAFAGGGAYNASKFGLIGFSEALMQDVRHDHIRVSCVMPGSVNTEFGQSSIQGPADIWKLTPEDVARVVIALLEMDPRALASRVELRPSEPPKH